MRQAQLAYLEVVLWELRRLVDVSITATPLAAAVVLPLPLIIVNMAPIYRMPTRR